MQLLRTLLERIAAGENEFQPLNETKPEFDAFQRIANRLIEARSQALVHDIRVMKSSSHGKLGIATVLVIGGLTFKGEQLLSVPIQDQTLPTSAKSPALDIFISHGSEDTDVAASMIKLLRSAFAVNPRSIRCTSVDGYRLSAGSPFNQQLRQEALESKAFVALLSASSLQSTYVLFELGARWGTGKYFAPIMIKGLKTKQLRQPLASLHAIPSSSEPEVSQFILDLGATLDMEPCDHTAYAAELKAFCSHVAWL